MNEVIASNLKCLRIMFGKTQRETANLMGVSKQSYSNIENGKRKISAEELWKIASELEVDMTIFFETKLTESVIKKLKVSS
ncbi:MAG TPA: helix-turn-helix transcriptional regulator [Erysipelothrix sp.]